MMKTQIFTYKDITKAASILQQGGLIAFPTETVYGLGVIYDNKTSFDRLVEVKRRRPDKPFTLMCAGVNDIADYAIVSEKTMTIINNFLPGPLTIILPIKPNLPEWVDLKTGSIGIRVSSLQSLQLLLVKVGKPLLVPSANRADEKPALSGEEALAIFDGTIEGVIMGTVSGGEPSTIIEVSPNDVITLRRPGPISFEKIIKTAEGR